MEHFPVDCAFGCDHRLAFETFDSRHFTSTAVSEEWAKHQIEQVLSSYERARAVMSRQGIHELCSFLKTGKWISPATSVSQHNAYRRVAGVGKFLRGGPYPYYPYFFVVQAIFEEGGEALQKMYFTMEQHWGVRLDPKEPFYPHLDNAERERVLFMGRPDSENWISAVLRSSSRQSSSNTQIMAIDDDSSSSDVQESTNSSSNTAPDKYQQELINIQNEFGKRLSEVQSQIEEEKAGSWEATQRKFDEAYEKTKELHMHAAQAQKYTDKAQDHIAKAQECNDQAQQHAETAVEMAKLLMERFASVGGGERRSKRLRKN
ncbi:uncharacterized protein B0J16DRAFT_395329 [Fusarium flagelliforme]|uniref:uncharacterized protein n=1 Tax=Fusarium flagelliforme TaxID=2675880 RepID=UPI001E8E28CC|nr:uncharacterized protein B0J16DRAFT_395329 [Fusarium flagelliforme]KAH7193363.1 hypothetical protein B0J16DRAFT_395329 [Fusarium flagelliforme]